MNPREAMDQVKDEPEGLRTRRGVQLLLIHQVIGKEDFTSYWKMSQKLYDEKVKNSLGKRRTQLGCFFFILRDHQLLNSEQLTAADAAAREIVYWFSHGESDHAEEELNRWSNKEVDYAECDDHMRQLLRDFRKRKKERKKRREEIRASRKNGKPRRRKKPAHLRR